MALRKGVFVDKNEWFAEKLLRKAVFVFPLHQKSFVLTEAQAMANIEDMVSGFDTISLADMGSVKLMNRVDTKYVTSMPRLRQLLGLAMAEYRVQEIDGWRNMPYYTCYFDTPGCDMYREHLRGRQRRQKIRLRIYEESETAFVEIKTKSNKGRTSKKRTLATDGYALAPYADFIAEHLRYPVDGLERQVENHFSRLTLVNKAMTERLTIDTDLWFHNVKTDMICSLDGLVIVELKRDGRVASPVQDMMRRLHIHPNGFSKYCIGMALTNHELRQNRLKPKLRMTSHLCHQTIGEVL